MSTTFVANPTREQVGTLRRLITGLGSMGSVIAMVKGRSAKVKAEVASAPITSQSGFGSPIHATDIRFVGKMEVDGTRRATPEVQDYIDGLDWNDWPE